MAAAEPEAEAGAVPKPDGIIKPDSVAEDTSPAVPSTPEPAPAEEAEEQVAIIETPTVPSAPEAGTVGPPESAGEPTSGAQDETPSALLTPEAVPTQRQTAEAEAPASSPAPATETDPDAEQDVAGIESASPATKIPAPAPEAAEAPRLIETPPTTSPPSTPPVPSVETATSEQPQVATQTRTPVQEEEPAQSIEITGVEASTPTDLLTAEASVDVLDLSGLAVAAAGLREELAASGEAAPGTPEAHDGTINAAAAGQPEELAVSGEAAPGIPDARDVTIKAAEVEDKMLYVAGDAPPGTLVRVYADDALVGEARTGIDGVWLLEAQKVVPVGEVVFRVEAAREADAATTPIVEASAPFMRYADGVVLEPVVTAESGKDAASLLAAGASPFLSYVIIRRGDNLWRIARRNYGRGIKYEAIYTANQDLIRNPHWIFPGQVFVIPTRDRSWEAVTQ